MSEQFVQGYFEQLAALHPDIAHSSEKPAFFRIQEEYNLDEFDRAVRATKSRTVLLLEFGEGDIAEG
ncbi:MAG: hypothetical protein INR69_17385, partial [Mucilaginibacter polytrichastri]|nr:hypothetical protein [Mucilaginibacter polytrichastri]